MPSFCGESEVGCLVALEHVEPTSRPRQIVSPSSSPGGTVPRHPFTISLLVFSYSTTSFGGGIYQCCLLCSSSRGRSRDLKLGQVSGDCPTLHSTLVILFNCNDSHTVSIPNNGAQSSSPIQTQRFAVCHLDLTHVNNLSSTSCHVRNIIQGCDGFPSNPTRANNSATYLPNRASILIKGLQSASDAVFCVIHQTAWRAMYIRRHSGYRSSFSS